MSRARDTRFRRGSSGCGSCSNSIPTGTTLNICVAYTIEGDLDADRLRDALATVHARHDILRTTYHADADGEPYLTIAETVTPVWTTHDIAGLDDTARARRLEVLARREFARPFDLDVDLPLRTTLVRTGPTSHTLILVVHHIAWDDDCWDPFFADLSAAYAGDLPAARDGVAQHLDLAVIDRTDTATDPTTSRTGVRTCPSRRNRWSCRGRTASPCCPTPLPGTRPRNCPRGCSTRSASSPAPRARRRSWRCSPRSTHSCTATPRPATSWSPPRSSIARPGPSARSATSATRSRCGRPLRRPIPSARWWRPPAPRPAARSRTRASGWTASSPRSPRTAAPGWRTWRGSASPPAPAGGAGLIAPGLTTRRADLHAAVAQVPLGLMVEWSDPPFRRRRHRRGRVPARGARRRRRGEPARALRAPARGARPAPRHTAAQSRPARRRGSRSAARAGHRRPVRRRRRHAARVGAGAGGADSRRRRGGRRRHRDHLRRAGPACQSRCALAHLARGRSRRPGCALVRAQRRDGRSPRTAC